jgi:hypothetical protein
MTIGGGDVGGTYPIEFEDPDGGWVSYEDASKILRRIERLHRWLRRCRMWLDGWSFMGSEEYDFDKYGMSLGSYIKELRAENRRLRNALQYCLDVYNGQVDSKGGVYRRMDEVVTAALASTEPEDDETYDLSSTDTVSSAQVNRLRELAKNVKDTPIDLSLYDDEEPEVCRWRYNRTDQRYHSDCGLRELYYNRRFDYCGKCGKRLEVIDGR